MSLGKTKQNIIYKLSCLKGMGLRKLILIEKKQFLTSHQSLASFLQQVGTGLVTTLLNAR